MNTPVQEIKEKLNIVDVVGEYVQLKKAGVNHKGRCPFHNEKTPSFTVSEPKQFYHCFGCGKGGDIFQFIQEVEGVEFAEALRLLAQKAGVELRAVNPREQNERTRLMDCLETATQFFHQELMTSSRAQVARTYLEGRKIVHDSLRTFRIGFAPESWDALLTHLQSKGFTATEIEQSGLSVRSQKGGHYDRFRNRIMFPIENAHGNVVGFTGRVLGSDVKEAKYVNTPQTLLFDKSSVLYGLSKAKPFIQKMNAVMLTEGQMDVVSCFQEKIRNVVASSGTALTHDQVRLLKRYTQNILLAFDGDSAGVHAAWKGMQIAIQEEMNIKVLALPEGKDPADLATEHADTLRELAGQAKPFMDYAFTAVLAPLDLALVHDKKKAAAELLPMIAIFPDPIERTHYLKELAGLLGVQDAVLQEKLEQVRRNQQKTSQRSPRTYVPASEQGSNAQEAVRTAQTTTAEPQGDTVMYQQINQVLALLSKKDSKGVVLAQSVLGDELPAQCEPTSEQQGLYKKLIDQYNQPVTTTDQSSQPNHTSGDFETTISMVGDELYPNMPADQQEKELRMLLVSLKRFVIQRSLRDLQSRLRQAERLQEHSSIEEYTRQLSLLTAQLKNLS